MSWRTLPQSLGVDTLALKAAAFELSPDPAMVVDDTGAPGRRQRGRRGAIRPGAGPAGARPVQAALPPGSALVSAG